MRTVKIQRGIHRLLASKFRKNRSFLLAILIFWVLMAASRIGLRLFGFPLAIDILLGRLTNYLAYVFICWLTVCRTAAPFSARVIYGIVT